MWLKRHVLSMDYHVEGYNVAEKVTSGRLEFLEEIGNSGHYTDGRCVHFELAWVDFDETCMNQSDHRIGLGKTSRTKWGENYHECQ